MTDSTGFGNQLTGLAGWGCGGEGGLEEAGQVNGMPLTKVENRRGPCFPPPRGIPAT